MTVTRRRFLSIAASFAAAPAFAFSGQHSWQGRAFGAEIEITLTGPRDKVRQALHQARGIIRQMEARFSLFDEASELVRLNQQGRAQVSAPFMRLVHIADWAHLITRGLFDPTVQPLWRAVAQGVDTATARARVGWHRVHFEGRNVSLSQGQALTFNGIAQGFATDAVTAALGASGFDNALVNIGEHATTGGSWQLGLQDPVHGMLATRTLTRGAIATSSPMATPIGKTGHILHATGLPQWSTVSVEAQSAAVADALSTGLVLADLDLVRSVRRTPGVHRITLVDRAGDLVTL